VRRSPRLIVAVAAWGLGLLYVLLAASALWLGLRLLLCAVAIGLILPVALRVLCCRGRAVVRRVVWERDGTWTVTLSSGVVERDCRLHGASAVAGPWLWLRLRGRGCHDAMLDRRHQEPVAFAALRRRLQVQRRRGELTEGPYGKMRASRRKLGKN
jgi:hypothetical protein